MIKDQTLIKNKKRVADHGEVFTSSREVNEMLNLVEQETNRIDSRFLEPACGDGNFLAEILKRKLLIVEDRYKKNQIEFERYALIAVSSIYGIDILADNVFECQERLLLIFSTIYKKIYQEEASKEYLENIQFVLSKNILWGDALTLKKIDNNQPITFCEWSAINGSKIIRRDFELAELLAYKPFNEPSLFSDLGEEVLIAKPKKEFRAVNFMELKNMEK